jgi:hypothetical protein
METLANARKIVHRTANPLHAFNSFQPGIGISRASRNVDGIGEGRLRRTKLRRVGRFCAIKKPKQDGQLAA